MKFNPKWNLEMRPLTSADADALAAHLQRLDRKARVMRFGANVTDRFLAGYARMPRGAQTQAIGLFANDTLIALGQLTRCPSDLGATAEAALTVDEHWRDTGLGTRMLGRLVACASDGGARAVRLLCMPLNLRLVHIARKFGAELRSVEGDLVLEIAIRQTAGGGARTLRPSGGAR
jgi:RimJ/RimL family protein N-acetyltransferase